jgi:hypothetical protein
MAAAINARWATVSVEVYVMLESVVAAGGVALTIVVVAWFFTARRHPEDAADHSDEHADTPSERFYGRHPPGPAGADAESQRPDDVGSAFNPPPPPPPR